MSAPSLKTVEESIDWSVEFNSKALEKLHIDIIPHPDEPDMHVALGNTFPMMDKMKAMMAEKRKSVAEPRKSVAKVTLGFYSKQRG